MMNSDADSNRAHGHPPHCHPVKPVKGCSLVLVLCYLGAPLEVSESSKTWLCIRGFIGEKVWARLGKMERNSSPSPVLAELLEALLPWALGLACGSTVSNQNKIVVRKLLRALVNANLESATWQEYVRESILSALSDAAYSERQKALHAESVNVDDTSYDEAWDRVPEGAKLIPAGERVRKRNRPGALADLPSSDRTFVLNKARAVLSPVLFGTFQSYFFEGQSTPEIANIWKVTPSAVRSRVFRARRALLLEMKTSPCQCAGETF